MKLKPANVLFLAVAACLAACPASQAADKPEFRLKINLQQEEDLAKFDCEVKVQLQVLPADPAKKPGVPGKARCTRQFVLDGVVLKQTVQEIATSKQSIINAFCEAQKKARLSGKIFLYIDGAWVKDSSIFYPERPEVKRVLKIEGLVSGIKKDGFRIADGKRGEMPELKEVKGKAQYQFELVVPAGTREILFKGTDDAGKPFTAKYTVQSYPERVYREGKVQLRPGDIFLVPIAKGDKKLVISGWAGAVETLLGVGAGGSHVVLKAKAPGSAAIGIEDGAGAKRELIELTVKPDAEQTKPEYVKPVAR